MWIPGNDRVLEENEVVSLHPSITFEDEEEAQQLRFIGTTDNVLVTAGGGDSPYVSSRPHHQSVEAVLREFTGRNAAYGRGDEWVFSTAR
jgi:carbamate kinase